MGPTTVKEIQISVVLMSGRVLLKDEPMPLAAPFGTLRQRLHLVAPDHKHVRALIAPDGTTLRDDVTAEAAGLRAGDVISALLGPCPGTPVIVEVDLDGSVHAGFAGDAKPAVVLVSDSETGSLAGGLCSNEPRDFRHQVEAQWSEVLRQLDISPGKHPLLHVESGLCTYGYRWKAELLLRVAMEVFWVTGFAIAPRELLSLGATRDGPRGWTGVHALLVQLQANIISQETAAPIQVTIMPVLDGRVLQASCYSFTAASEEDLFTVTQSLGGQARHGLSDLVYGSLLRVDPEMRSTLARSIRLLCARSEMPGLAERVQQRLQTDMAELTRNNANLTPAVELLSPERAWQEGLVFASQLQHRPEYHDTRDSNFWISRQQYDCHGPHFIHGF